MKTPYSYLELAYLSMQIFANDGKVDMEELNQLLGIALRDNQIDEDEKRILQNIFAQVRQNEVNEKVWERIHEIRKQYQF